MNPEFLYKNLFKKSNNKERTYFHLSWNLPIVLGSSRGKMELFWFKKFCAKICIFSITKKINFFKSFYFNSKLKIWQTKDGRRSDYAMSLKRILQRISTGDSPVTFHDSNANSSRFRKIRTFTEITAASCWTCTFYWGWMVGTWFDLNVSD